MSSKKSPAGDCANILLKEDQKSSVCYFNTPKSNESVGPSGDKKDMLTSTKTQAPSTHKGVRNADNHESWKDVVERFSHDLVRL